MDFSEAYRKVVKSGIFVLRNGAPVKVSEFHPGDKAKFKKHRTSNRSLEQIIMEAKEPRRLKEEDIGKIGAPSRLALDLAQILVGYYNEIELPERIDSQSIVRKGVEEELAKVSHVVKGLYKTLPKKLEKLRLSEIEKMLKPGKPDIHSPCIKAFRRHLNIKVDDAYWYTAHFLSGAKVMPGNPQQIYYRIQKAISRSKKLAND